jgi:hypothetical protein
VFSSFGCVTSPTLLSFTAEDVPNAFGDFLTSDLLVRLRAYDLQSSTGGMRQTTTETHAYSNVFQAHTLTAQDGKFHNVGHRYNVDQRSGMLLPDCSMHVVTATASEIYR